MGDPYRRPTTPAPERPRGIVVRRVDDPREDDEERRRRQARDHLEQVRVEVERTRTAHDERERAAALERDSHARARVEKLPVVGHVAAIRQQPYYRRLRAVLAAMGVFAPLASIALVSPAILEGFEQPLLTSQGVDNFVFHLLHAEGASAIATSAVVLLAASPWLALPWIARRGLALGERWGWLAAIAACVVFLPTPMILFSVYALRVLGYPPVRAVYHA